MQAAISRFCKREPGSDERTHEEVAAQKASLIQFHDENNVGVCVVLQVN